MSQTQRISKNNTKILTANGIKTIRLYNTDIVIITQKHIVLNTGGYNSVTTKTRMNQVSNELGLGYGVYQSKGYWFCTYKGQTIPFGNNDSVILERD